MKKILIVDDDITFRTALRYSLEHQGYAVTEAESGSEALDVFAQTPSNVVVSDIVMPGMDGLEFCRRLRSIRAGQLVPFIFLSALNEVDDRVQGYQMGADDYLVKPFELKELVAKIESQLERSRRLDTEIVQLMQHSTDSTPKSLPRFLPMLTPVEEKIFWEVVQGFTNQQIGERFFVSPDTVQSHLSNIFSKLELEDRAQLIRDVFEPIHRASLGAEEA